MKFLCLCHYDATAFAAFRPAEFEEIGRICRGGIEIRPADQLEIL